MNLLDLEMQEFGELSNYQLLKEVLIAVLL
jgi:hypothetical protein